MGSVKIFGKHIGNSFPCYIIAEIGGAFSNFEEAKRLIDSAKKIGIDAIKFQTLEAETITTKNNFFDMEATGQKSQYEIFKHFEISKDLQKDVVEYSNSLSMPIFSAPSHMKDLEIMEQLELPIYKIGSDLACHIPLLKKIAQFNKPIILSTGMCTMKEVENSVNAIKNEGNEKIILMHCVSNYPSKMEELNLNSIEIMKKEFNLPVGFSDHTPGILGTVTSVSFGANIIERHFRDPRNKPGPDDIHSLTENEFINLISSIKMVEQSSGTGIKTPTLSEQNHLLTNRVSIIAMQDIPPGTIITEKMIDIRRPGTGIQPIHFEQIFGKKTTKHIDKEQPLLWDYFE
jgi:N,N'-diacetyllegionaminate synthase